MPCMRRLRTVSPVRPVQSAQHRGLAFTLWRPAGDATPQGGIVVLHGAGSRKESHHDFARAALPLGLAALCYDARGHGASEGPMDGRAIDDVAAMADLLRASVDPELPVALRGSSMGGYFALASAVEARARAVVAICPAPASLLRGGLRSGALGVPADVPAVEALLAAHELSELAGSIDAPVLLLHAEGDERVPVSASRELAPRLGHPASRLLTVPGGHHRSIQHDDELQAVSLRFILRALSARE